MIPPDSEEFMIMLKRFSNLLSKLFYSSYPLYKQVYAIIKYLSEYSQNSRAAHKHNTKTTILWILLLQAQRFSWGDMVGMQGCLGEPTNTVNQLAAKIERTSNI